MVTFDLICVHPDIILRDAASRIQESVVKALLVCDHTGKLLGTLTDGDIRRAVSSGASPEDGIQNIMNTNPKTADMEISEANLRRYMRDEILTFIPRVDAQGRVKELVMLDHTIGIQQRQTHVVLMAGGQGKRLRPLTLDIPKPLLTVGRRPVLEHQILQLKRYGLTKFHLSVNYLADQIKDYFGDGSSLGVEIDYIDEDKPLGTAGALSELPVLDAPVLVMNGDILAKIDFGMMIDMFHAKEVSAMIGVREHQYTVPYGCVVLENDLVSSICEKPTFHHLINAGIYLFAPDVLSMIPKDSFFDMPDLLNMLLEKERNVGSFLVTEEWIDIGHKQDLEWARKVYSMEN